MMKIENLTMICTSVSKTKHSSLTSPNLLTANWIAPQSCVKDTLCPPHCPEKSNGFLHKSVTCVDHLKHLSFWVDNQTFYHRSSQNNNFLLFLFYKEKTEEQRQTSIHPWPDNWRWFCGIEACKEQAWSSSQMWHSLFGRKY